MDNQTFVKKNMTNVSLLRLISALLIFSFHIIISFTSIEDTYFPFYFAVQIFLFISGYLYGKKKIKSVKQFYIKNTIKILIPTIIFVCFTYIFLLFVQLCGRPFDMNMPTPAGRSLFIFGHLWFIPAIIVCYLFTPMLEYVCHVIFDKPTEYNKKKFNWYVVILVFACAVNICLSMVLKNTSVGGLQSIVLAYFAGYFFRNIQFNFKLKKWLVILISLLIFGVLSASHYVIYNYTNFFATSAGGGIKDFFLFLMGSSFAIAFLLSFEFLNKRPCKIDKFLKFTDRFAFTFYLAHPVFMTGSGGLVLYGVLNNFPAEIFLMFLCAVIFAIFIDVASSPIIKYLTNKR